MKILLLALALISVLAKRNFYKILEVDPKADKKAIRKAFKKQSLKYHPDKNKDKTEWAKEKFIEVSNAYEVLYDDEKRQIYDKYGEEGLKQSEQQQNAQQGQRFHGSFEDIFSNFFHGRGQRGQGGHRHSFFQEEEEEENLKTNEFQNTDIIEIDMKTLSKLYRRNENWFKIFFKIKNNNFAKIVELGKTLAEKVYGIFKVAVVNCDTDEEICHEFGVYNTPKFMFIPEASNNYETVKGIDISKGAEEWIKFLSYGSERMQSFVRNLNLDNWNDFITTNPTQYKIISFTKKKKSSPLLKALSKFYRGKLDFGEVRENETSLLQKFGEVKFPSLFVVQDGVNFVGEFYTGELKRDHIEKYLNKFAYQKIAIEKKPEISELNSYMFKKLNNCNETDSKTICLVLLTGDDKLSDANSEILKDLSKKYLNEPLRVYWTNRENSIRLLKSIDSDHITAQALFIKGKRKRYFYVEKGNKDEITKTAESILSGTGKSYRLKKNIDFDSNIHDEL